jgi:hypothetical protein
MGEAWLRNGGRGGLKNRLQSCLQVGENRDPVPGGRVLQVRPPSVVVLPPNYAHLVEKKIQSRKKTRPRHRHGTSVTLTYCFSVDGRALVDGLDAEDEGVTPAEPVRSLEKGIEGHF